MIIGLMQLVINISSSIWALTQPTCTNTELKRPDRTGSNADRRTLRITIAKEPVLTFFGLICDLIKSKYHHLLGVLWSRTTTGPLTRYKGNGVATHFFSTFSTHVMLTARHTHASFSINSFHEFSHCCTTNLLVESRNQVLYKFVL